MKKFLFGFLAFALGGLLISLSSCQKSDDFTGKATWKAANSAGSLDNSGPFTIVETNEDILIPITLTLSEPQIADITINVTVVPGATATVDEDFTYDASIFIPAHHTTGVCNVKIIGDSDAENDETFSLQFGDSTTTNVNFPTKVIDFTIKSQDLTLVFDWGGEITYGGSSVSLCDSVDLDFYVMSADTTDMGIYDAATGACPEGIIFSNYANGDYYFWTAIYQNQIRPSSGAIDFPVAITAQRPGEDAQALNQPAGSNINSDDTDYANDGAQTLKSLIKVTVKDGGFDIINPYTNEVMLSL